jgi:hypothetical protein
VGISDRSGTEADHAIEQGQPQSVPAAAMIRTCSDDEDYAVLDLGGGYCSSSDGSGDGWHGGRDEDRIYQAPRCVISLCMLLGQARVAVGLYTLHSVDNT